MGRLSLSSLKLSAILIIVFLSGKALSQDIPPSPNGPLLDIPLNSATWQKSSSHEFRGLTFGTIFTSPFGTITCNAAFYSDLYQVPLSTLLPLADKCSLINEGISNSGWTFPAPESLGGPFPPQMGIGI